MHTQTRRYLEALFLPGELVATFGPTPKGSDLVYYGPWENAVAAEYVNMNPLSTDSRQAALMGDYRSFLLEFDSVSLEQQLVLLAALEKLIPIRTVVYSGNKSYAAIISLADTLITGQDGEMRAHLYSEYFKRLRAAVEALLKPLVTERYTGNLVDAANADASRLTRLPGTMNRHWKEPTRDATEQTLISTGGLVTADALEAFIQKYAPPMAAPTLITHEPCYNGSFERTLNNQSHLKPLRNKLLMPEYWGGANGNHPLIYRYTHWAIDATGVSEAEFTAYVTKYTAPYLLSLGYPLWKVEEAIAGAYRVRRFRM